MRVFKIETQVAGGIPSRDFNEYAPIEIVDGEGHTLAAFRDATGYAWSWLVKERPEVTVAVYAYGARIGRWMDLAPRGVEAFEAALHQAWSDYEAANEDWSKV